MVPTLPSDDPIIGCRGTRTNVGAHRQRVERRTSSLDPKIGKCSY
jgi:hypothetical protein